MIPRLMGPGHPMAPLAPGQRGKEFKGVFLYSMFTDAGGKLLIKNCITKFTLGASKAEAWGAAKVRGMSGWKTERLLIEVPSR